MRSASDRKLHIIRSSNDTIPKSESRNWWICDQDFGGNKKINNYSWKKRQKKKCQIFECHVEMFRHVTRVKWTQSGWGEPHNQAATL